MRRWFYGIGNRATAGMRQFSAFRLDDLNQCLWRKGPDGEQRVPLAPKAYSVLCHLVDHAGQLVTQRDLLQSVWGEREVDQSVLKMQILEPSLVEAWVFSDDMKREFKRLVSL